MQAELFDLFVSKGYEHLAGGCYGQVYFHPASDWIIKKANNDGTRTYLEWVVLKTRKGERMRGMPEIDFIVPVDESRYMVAMKRYQPMNNKLEAHGFSSPHNVYSVHHASGCPQYLKDLVAAFERENPAVRANDVHHGNVMFNKKTQTFILTDPSSSTYAQTGSGHNRWDGKEDELELTAG